jgi:hypothetical protein
MAQGPDLRAAALAGLFGCAVGFAAGRAVRGVPAGRERSALAPGAAASPAPLTVWIVAPMIGPQVAEDVLAQLEQLPAGAAPTIVLHTYGGVVGACMMIAGALRQLPRSTAVVPYLAHSGGTLIALSASTLAMGANATLSAVDPIVRGHRARHIPDDKKHARLRQRAREYDAAVSGYLRGVLEGRLPPAQVRLGMSMFMGEDAPHEWPIRRDDVRRLGIPVLAADQRWARHVDAIRESATIWP